MKKVVDIKDINIKESPMVRADLRRDVVEEYAEMFRQKKSLPPPDLYMVKSKENGSTLLIADGRHRIEAAIIAGLKTIVGEIVEGNRVDCLKAALASNVAHGIRRTNADKRKCIELALAEWPKMSSREIANSCAVSHTMVDEVRKPATAASSNPEKRMGADGKVRKVKPRAAKPKSIKSDQDNPEPEKPAVVAAVTTDAIGIEIPAAVMPMFQRINEGKSLVDAMSSILKVLNSASQDKDPLYRELNFNVVTADMKGLITAFKTVIPYTVCPTCQGKVKTDCVMCRGRGCISEFKWKTVVPEELRRIRERLGKK